MQRAFNTAVAVCAAGVSVFYPRCVRHEHMPVTEPSYTLCAWNMLVVHVRPVSSWGPTPSYVSLGPHCIMQLLNIVWVYSVALAADEGTEPDLKYERSSTVTLSLS